MLHLGYTSVFIKQRWYIELLNLSEPELLESERVSKINNSYAAVNVTDQHDKVKTCKPVSDEFDFIVVLKKTKTFTHIYKWKL